VKTLSERADVVVVGAGLAGLCAAMTAARNGATVKLIETRNFLGGRIGDGVRFPFDQLGGANFIYQRESGILDELYLRVLLENREGNYAGQNRALMNWVSEQERLDVFLGSQVFEVSLGNGDSKIESILAISERLGSRILFRGRYFVDCTGNGALAQMAKASGESGVDLTEYSEDGSPQSIESRFATSMRIGESVKEVPFECPSWVRLKWEDNHLSAKLDLLESLNRNLLGDHNVEWINQVAPEINPGSGEIVWAAWDFLKNRSPMVDRAARLVVEDFSAFPLMQDGFRAKGDFVLNPHDMESGRTYPDSVAVGRAPLDLEDAMLCSMRGKVALPHPFEIPLRCLYSKSVKNLFFAGGHASCTSRASASLRHPPTSAQLGEAAGLAAVLCIRLKRLPKTLSKSGYVDELRRLLYRSNHACSVDPQNDSDDLLCDARVTASSTLSVFSPKDMGAPLAPSPSKGMIQFPAMGPELKGVRLFLEVREDCVMQCGLLEASSHLAISPGVCLDRIEIELTKGPLGWVEIPFAIEMIKPGWHFLEFSWGDSIVLYGQEDAPVGILLHRPVKSSKSTVINPYSEYSPATSRVPGPSSAPMIETVPKQRVYGSANLTNGRTCPDRLPQLWISEPTDFRYPEFLEFHWDEPREISSIDLVFDASSEFLVPARPTKFSSACVTSIVSHYKIFFMDKIGHWKELIEVKGNTLSFRTHEFPTVSTNALEFEIISTHGLDRAQVYQVRAYP
jgi:hypothetical protein